MHRGFTLVELLVTIAIVGILAGMSLALYEQYKGVAHEAQATLMLKNGVTAVEAYKIEQDNLNFHHQNVDLYPDGSVVGVSAMLEGVPTSKNARVFLRLYGLTSGLNGRVTGYSYACNGVAHDVGASKFRRTYTYNAVTTWPFVVDWGRGFDNVVNQVFWCG